MMKQQTARDQANQFLQPLAIQRQRHRVHQQAEGFARPNARLACGKLSMKLPMFFKRFGNAKQRVSNNIGAGALVL